MTTWLAYQVPAESGVPVQINGSLCLEGVVVIWLVEGGVVKSLSHHDISAKIACSICTRELGLEATVDLVAASANRPTPTHRATLGAQ